MRQSKTLGKRKSVFRNYETNTKELNQEEVNKNDKLAQQLTNRMDVY